MARRNKVVNKRVDYHGSLGKDTVWIKGHAILS